MKIAIKTFPTAVAAMQACVRIGAPHAVVFAGFSPGALADRINDSGARVLITMDGAKRGGKTVNLKGIADEAIPNCPGLAHCFVAGGLDDGIASCTNKIDIDLDAALNIISADCKPTIVESGTWFHNKNYLLNRTSKDRNFR